MNDFQRLHAACLARLRRLPMPVPFEFEEFRRRFAAERGRSLSILAWPQGAVPASITGACVSYPDQDVIYYQPWATGLHRMQIVLHEIAHLAWGHIARDARRPTQALEAAGLFDMLEPDLLARFFARHDNYADDEEREAEMLASLMMQHAMRHAGGVGDPLVSRLHAALAPVERGSGRG